MKTKKVLLYLLFVFLLTVSAMAVALCIWYKNTFDLDFKTLLYVMASPLQGTGNETIKEVVAACLPTGIGAALTYYLVAVLIEKNISAKSATVAKLVKRIGAVFCAASVVFAAIFAVFALGVNKHIVLTTGETSFYEEYYVDPGTVKLKENGKAKNLLYIYLESMESAYASTEDGGRQTENFIPLLTELARNNISFTEKSDGTPGGFHTPQGTGWTMAALLATSSGIPFSFPLGENGNNNMSKEKIFASGLTTLGDILEDYGYRQMFLCGSDIAFGGRDKYYIQHGNYEIYDLATARRNGVVPADYHNGFWGIEDEILFDIAKEELTKIAKGDEPFNFTLLTVDLHHNGGYICDLCVEREYADVNEWHGQTATVATCTDKQVTAFIEWCKEQDWYEDTVIVITGDHPRMDSRLMKGVDYADRTIYNCILNSAVEPKEGSTVNRTWTSFDVFPTTLAAMGFEIKGERLGLGTNMFSGIPTLAEELGYETLETEIQKFSAYYINKFCPELADRVVETEPTETEVIE